MKTFDELFNELTLIAATRPADSGTVAALDGGLSLNDVYTHL